MTKKNDSRWNTDSVVEEASKLVDKIGFEELSLAILAKHLQIQSPSLYKHIDGLEDLKTRIKVYGTQSLLGELTKHAIGKSGDEVFFSVAEAYREFTLKHPGLQAAINYNPSSKVKSDIKKQSEFLSNELVNFGFRILNAYNLDRATAIHAIRTLRSLVHGFAILESGGTFQMKTSTDESYKWAINALVKQLKKEK